MFNTCKTTTIFSIDAGSFLQKILLTLLIKRSHVLSNDRTL